MGKTIELPDPLFAEIDGYAHRVSASPISVIRQAWDEFLHHHPQETTTPLHQTASAEELLAIVRTLRCSISLPANVDDKTLIAEARSEKYGPPQPTGDSESTIVTRHFSLFPINLNK